MKEYMYVLCRDTKTHKQDWDGTCTLASIATD